MFPKQKIDEVPDNDRIRTFFPLSIPVDGLNVIHVGPLYFSSVGSTGTVSQDLIPPLKT